MPITIHRLEPRHRFSCAQFLRSFAVRDPEVVDICLELQSLGYGFTLVAEADDGDIVGMVKAAQRINDHSQDDTTAIVSALFAADDAVARSLCLELIEALYDERYSQVVYSVPVHEAPRMAANGWDLLPPGYGYAWTDSVNRHAARWYEPLDEQMQLAHLTFMITSLVGWDYPLTPDRNRAIRQAFERQRERLHGAERIGEFLID